MSRRAPAARRRLFWARAREFVIPSQPGNVVIHNLLADFEGRYGAQLLGFTVTRIRGRVAWYPQSDANRPVGTAAAFGFGIRVADDQTIATAVDQDEEGDLLPRFSPESDWMHVEEHLAFARNPTDPNAPRDFIEYELDVKAQRRIDELGQGLYLFFGEPLSAINSLPNNYFYDLSILLKRP